MVAVGAGVEYAVFEVGAEGVAYVVTQCASCRCRRSAVYAVLAVGACVVCPVLAANTGVAYTVLVVYIGAEGVV